MSKEFTVNENGVVSNGNLHIIIKNNDPKWRGCHLVECETASKNNKWYCEIDYMFKDRGRGTPLMFEHSKKYESENEAIMESIKILISELKQDSINNEYVKKLKEYMRANEQLTFF